jgi:hypothetical protein
MTLNLPHGHATRVHRDDLRVEAGEPALVLGDQPGIERALPVARNAQFKLAGLGDHRLGRIAIAPVDFAAGRLTLKMVVHLRVQHPVRQSLLQLVEQAVLGKNIPRVTSRKQQIQCVFLDSHLHPPSAT